MELDLPASTWIDWGCSEGMHIFYRPEKLKNWQRIGYDKNAAMMEFLSENKARIGGNRAIKDGKDFQDVQFGCQSLEEESQQGIAGLNSIEAIGANEETKSLGLVTFFSVLQYVKDPFKTLDLQLLKLRIGGYVMAYMPVAHHQYTPWYRWAFRNLQNYESVNSRQEPIWLEAWNKYLNQQAISWEVAEYKNRYYALAAIGHEQFSFAQMLMQFQLKHPAAFLYQKLVSAINLIGYLYAIPAWIISLILFYADPILPIGQPNSVWVVLKKK